MSKTSKEYSVTLPAEESQELEAIAHERGVKPAAIIRERYRRGLPGGTPAVHPAAIAANAPDAVAQPGIALEALTTLLEEKVAPLQTAVAPLAEQLQPFQARLELLQAGVEGLLMLLDWALLDGAPAEEKQQRLEIITEVKRRLAQQAAMLGE